MQDLSIAQKYMVCAVNNRGGLPTLSTNKQICFVAAGVLELEMEQCISIDNNIIAIAGRLPERMRYLFSLYEYIHKHSPIKTKQLFEEYNYSVIGKRLNALLSDVGKSLAEQEALSKFTNGFLGYFKRFVPKRETVEIIVDEIRAELLEDGEITDNCAALVVLLAKSGCLSKYFSPFERRKIKDKLSFIVNSSTGTLIKKVIAHIENLIALNTGVLGVFGE